MPAMTPIVDNDTTRSRDVSEESGEVRAEPLQRVPSQDILFQKVNPAKLATMLRSKFGVGSFEVFVSQTHSQARLYRRRSTQLGDASRYSCSTGQAKPIHIPTCRK